MDADVDQLRMFLAVGDSAGVASGAQVGHGTSGGVHRHHRGVFDGRRRERVALSAWAVEVEARVNHGGKEARRRGNADERAWPRKYESTKGKMIGLLLDALDEAYDRR